MSETNEVQNTAAETVDAPVAEAPALTPDQVACRAIADMARDMRLSLILRHACAVLLLDVAGIRGDL